MKGENKLINLILHCSKSHGKSQRKQRCKFDKKVYTSHFDCSVILV